MVDEPAPILDPSVMAAKERDALRALAGDDPAALGYLQCGCGCYHPVQRDGVGRPEVRFACPHPTHTVTMLDGTPRTYTNPPNDGAVLSG